MESLQNQPLEVAADDASTSTPSLSIAATFTAEPIKAMLSFWLEKLGLPSHVQFASYNQIFQALLDPASVLSSATWAAALLIRFEDWIEGEKAILTAREWAERITPLIDELLAALAPGRSAPLIVVICPPSQKIRRDVADVLEAMQQRVVAALAKTPGVYAFAASAVDNLYPVVTVHDPQADNIGKIPYMPVYFTGLATFIVRMAHAIRRPPFKVIALDCDNTLWRGVCGEGAVDIDPGHRALQQFAIQQSEAGKLLCLASKNVEQDVFAVFEQHPDILLQRERLAGYRINWSAKSENLRDLARELNVGLDSFIFLDDNPIECAEVRANAPQVLALQLPADESRISRFLQHVWAFDQLRVTEQDRSRAQSYLLGAQREAVRQDSTGLEDFLRKLQLEVEFAPVDASNLARAAQMTERTNQFNASTIRRNEAQIQELLRDTKHKAEVVHVKDRFGDYGIVGLIISRPQNNVLLVDTFLLSCRVLGRGVEHQILARAGNAAVESGLQFVDVPFVRTARNQPIADFLNAVALDHRNATDGGFMFHLPATFAAAVKASVITSAPAEEAQTPTASQKPVEASTATAPYQQIADQWSDPVQILAAVDVQRMRGRGNLQTIYRSPRTEREEKLKDIWQRVLGVENIGVDDDYFKLGGTSIMAVRLVLEVEKIFHRHLPIATLLAAPTIAQFALRLGEPAEVDVSAVVTLRAEGLGAPLFLFPGIGGHVLSYRQLAQLLETSQPVYGLEMREEDPQNRVARSMEKIASEVVDRLLRIEPSGPYLLAGWSFGGALAFEAAHQLRRRGKNVAMIALFDTFAHGYPRTLSRSERIRSHVQHFFRRSFAEQTRYASTGVRSVFNMVKHRILMRLGIRKTEFFSYESPEIEQVVKVCDDAWQAYRPSKWPGRLTLLRGTVRPDRIGVSYDDPANGWGKFADEVDVLPVNTDHLGFFIEPAVQQTAAELSKALRAANAKSG